MLTLAQRGERVVTTAIGAATVGLGYLALRFGGTEVIGHIGNAINDIGSTNVELPQATQDAALQSLSLNTTEALKGAGLDMLVFAAAGLRLARTSN